VDLNATQAAIRAGYSQKTADRIGPELLGRVHTSHKAVVRRNVNPTITMTALARMAGRYLRMQTVPLTMNQSKERIYGCTVQELNEPANCNLNCGHAAFPIVLGVSSSLPVVLAGLIMLSVGMTIWNETGTLQHWVDALGLKSVQKLLLSAMLLCGIAIVAMGYSQATPGC